MKKVLYVFLLVCLLTSGCATSESLLPTATQAATLTPTLLPHTSTPTLTPTRTATPLPTDTPSPTLTPTPAWETYRSEDLHLKISFPPGWKKADEDGDLWLSSSKDGLDEGIFSLDPVLLLWRYPQSMFDGSLEEELIYLGLMLDGSVEKTTLDGQEAVSTLFHYNSSNGSAKGQVLIARADGVATVVILASTPSTWPKNKAVLQQVLVSLKLDDEADTPPMALMPPALTDPLPGLLEAKDTPNNYEPISRASFFRARRSEGYYTLWLQGIGAEMSGAQIDQFQGFANQDVNENILVFTSHPLTNAQVGFIDRLLANPQRLANAVNRDPSVHTTDTSDVEFTVLAGTESLGEKGLGVSIQTGDPFYGYQTVDFILIRRGAKLVVVRHLYIEEPGIDEEGLLEIATSADRRLQELLTAQPELAKPAVSVATVVDERLGLITQIPQANFTFPEGYHINEGFTEEFVQDRFNRYGSRVLVFEQYEYENGDQKEFAQLWVIGPLDATERQAFPWLLQSPQALAEYFMGPYMQDRGYSFFTYAELYTSLPKPLPEGLGEYAYGITLVYGAFKQDVVVVAYGDLLLAASVLHFEDAPVVADVGDLAAQLYAHTDSLLAGK